MFDKPFLRAFVVVRRDDQKSVRAEILRHTASFDCVARAIRACADYDGNSTSRLLYANFDHLLLFFFGQRCRLARSAERDKSVHAACDLSFHDFAKSLHVHFVIFCERGDERGGCASENHLFRYASIAFFMSNSTI